MFKITPYINFDGKCAEAFALYEKLFDGKITFIQTFGESPMADTVPVEYHGAIMHVSLTIGDQTLNGSDGFGEHLQKPGGYAVSISLDDFEKGARIFKELVKDGIETMAYQETFWAKGFGMCTDRFGIPWMINVEKPMEG